MCWYISEVFLYLLHFSQTKAWLAWFVIHLEEFDFFKFVLCLPADRLGLFLPGFFLVITVDRILGLFIYSVLEVLLLTKIRLVARGFLYVLLYPPLSFWIASALYISSNGYMVGVGQSPKCTTENFC